MWKNEKKTKKELEELEMKKKNNETIANIQK